MEKLKLQEEIISNLCLELNLSSEKIKEFKKKFLDVGNKEQIIASKSKFVDWAFLVHDFNRMHIFPGYASEFGFRKNPMHGTWITAFEEQYILKIKEILEEFIGKELYYNKHRVKFEQPIFPGLRSARANWNLEKAVVSDKGIKLGISATDGKQEKYISSTVFLDYEKNQKPPEEIIAFLSGDNLVHKTSIEIKKGERDRFFYCLNKKSDGKLYLMHSAALVPATLLELSSRRTGRPTGAYREIDFEFYNQPELGIFETHLRLPRDSRQLPEGKGFLYKFEALCLQNKKLILSGKVSCISPTEFKL